MNNNGSWCTCDATCHTQQRDWKEINAQPNMYNNMPDPYGQGFKAGKADERKRVAEYIRENRHKIERMDRYVLDDLLSRLTEEK